MSIQIGFESKAFIAVIATVWANMCVAMASAIQQVSLESGFDVVCGVTYV